MNRPSREITKLLADCRSRGIRLSVADGGLLEVDAPQSALAGGLLTQLERVRDEIVLAIELAEERAAIAEFDGGLSRDEAERFAIAGLSLGRSREPFCCWCRSEELTDDDSGLRCSKCGRMAWWMIESRHGWRWLRADQSSSDLGGAKP